MDKMEVIISSKLAYEWKNIFRQLYKMDLGDSGLVELYDFDRTCLMYNINLSKEEIGKIYKNYKTILETDVETAIIDQPYGYAYENLKT